MFLLQKNTFMWLDNMGNINAKKFPNDNEIKNFKKNLWALYAYFQLTLTTDQADELDEYYVEHYKALFSEGHLDDKESLEGFLSQHWYKKIFMWTRQWNTFRNAFSFLSADCIKYNIAVRWTYIVVSLKKSENTTFVLQKSLFPEQYQKLKGAFHDKVQEAIGWLPKRRKRLPVLENNTSLWM